MRMVMTNQQRDETLIQIEETQAALRDSIERARQLAEQSAELVRKHRQDIAEPPADRNEAV